MEITRAKGGSDERKMDVNDVQVPDLWHIAMAMGADKRYELHAKDVLETWHLAHDLLRELKARAS